MRRETQKARTATQSKRRIGRNWERRTRNYIDKRSSDRTEVTENAYNPYGIVNICTFGKFRRNALMSCATGRGTDWETTTQGILKERMTEDRSKTESEEQRRWTTVGQSGQ